jgi:transposase
MDQLSLFPRRSSRGRPRALISGRQELVAQAMLRAGATTAEVAAFLGVSRTTARDRLGQGREWTSKPGRGPHKRIEPDA